MGTTMSEPCIYDKLSESIDILRQSGYRYGMSEREIERFIKRMLETNEPRREPPQFPLLRATLKSPPRKTPAVCRRCAVAGHVGHRAAGGAGLHVPARRDAPGRRPPAVLQLVVAAQPRAAAGAAHRQEVQPARLPRMVEFGLASTQPGQLLGLRRRLVGAGGARQPPRERHAAARAPDRPLKGRRVAGHRAAAAGGALPGALGFHVRPAGRRRRRRAQRQRRPPARARQFHPAVALPFGQQRESVAVALSQGATLPPAGQRRHCLATLPGHAPHGAAPRQPGRGGPGLAGGGRGSSHRASCSRSALPQTLQLLQPVAQRRRHGVRRPSLLADVALPGPRPEHRVRRLGLLSNVDGGRARMPSDLGDQQLETWRERKKQTNKKHDRCQKNGEAKLNNQMFLDGKKNKDPGRTHLHLSCHLPGPAYQFFNFAQKMKSCFSCFFCYLLPFLDGCCFIHASTCCDTLQQLMGPKT
ncbi:bombesin receptor-activated protein C6orf89 homolog isoform X1 [Festucalex cinctus]